MLKSTRILGLWVLVIDSNTKYSYSIILKVAYSKLVYSTPALVRIYSDVGDLWSFQVVVSLLHVFNTAYFPWEKVIKVVAINKSALVIRCFDVFCSLENYKQKT